MSDAVRESQGQGEQERADRARQQIEAKRGANAKRIATEKARMKS